VQFANNDNINTMAETQDFKSLQEQVQSALIATTRTAGQVASEDLGFHRSFNNEVGTALDEQSQRLLSLASALLKSAASIAELRAPVLEDADDVENNWRSVVDVVDSLLEKSDICLDEYTGVIKRKEPTANEQSPQVLYNPSLVQVIILTIPSLLRSPRRRPWDLRFVPRTSSNHNLPSLSSRTMTTIRPGNQPLPPSPMPQFL
jgi:hypothetical protein